MKENGQKKLVYILIAEVCVILLILVAIAGYFVLGGISGKQKEKDVAEATEETLQEEGTETAEVREKTEDQNTSELLQSFYEDMLAESDHPIDYDRTYTAPYIEMAADDYKYPLAGYVEGLDGPLTYKIMDFDNDGEEELLVMAIVDNDKEEEPDHILELQMYEHAEDEVQLQARSKTCLWAVGGFDIQNADYYIKEDDSHIYIAENVAETVCVAADGTNYCLRVLHYDGSDFVEDTEQDFGGSDFSDLEDLVAETASDLESIGFTNSAAKLTYELQFQPEDEMEEFFIVRGANEGIYLPDSGVFSYYETQDISAVGELTYHFYNDKETYYEKNKITGYRKQKDDFSASRDGATVNAFFERVIFEGNNETGINWLNQQIIDLENSYKDNLDPVEEELDNLLESPYEETEWDYEPHSVESVYYNEAGDVSVGYGWYWYMGGVSNSGWQSVNCNVYTRKIYSFADILGVDWETARRQLRRALIDQAGFEEEYLDIEKIPYNPVFYFDEDTVTVCFESYSLDQGPGGMQVTLPRQ